MAAFRPSPGILTVLVFCFALPAQAAPLNDNFSNANPLGGLITSAAGSNVGATEEVGEPDHAGIATSNSVWWVWTPVTPYTVMQADTIGSSFDTVLAVYLGDRIGFLDRIAWDDESGGNHTSKLIFNSGSGIRSAHIAVDGFRGATGLIRLNLAALPPPANDLFANAILIPGLTNSVTGNNTNALVEFGEAPHGNNPYGRSVWWRWTATTNWGVLLDATASSFSPILEAFQGTNVTNLTLLASSALSSKLTFQPQQGQTYRFAADGWGGQIGSIVLNLRSSPPPLNDAFAAAFTITGLTNTVTGDNTFATKEASEPNHAGSTAGKSLWWRWTAPTNWAVILDSFNSSFSTALAVYTGGSVSTLKTVASSNSAQLSFTASAGATYRIAADSSSPTSGSGDFTLHLRAIPGPTNNSFAAAASISGTTINLQGSLFGGTTEAFEPSHAGDAASVWYRWVAPRSGRVRLSSDERIAVYSGDRVSNLILVSRDAPEAFHFRYLQAFEAAATKVYSIAVTGAQAQDAPFSVRLDYAPLNDDFEAAFVLAGVSNRVQGSTVGATLETGEPEVEDMLSGNSAWWTFIPPGDGMLEFSDVGPSHWPALWVYEGPNVSNLTLRADNRVPTTVDFLRCTFSCDVLRGHTYYLATTGDETNFIFDMVFKAAPPNDAFASRLTIEPTARVAFSSTVGATREVGEPGLGSNTVWWSWTPTQAYPVILTTYGSACDTVLSVYTGVGNSVTSLVRVVSNDDGYVWTTNSAAKGWTTTNGPTTDVISRLRLNADNNVQFKIAVSVAPTNQPPGEVTLNFTRLAIDDITSATRTTNPDRSVRFDANLRLVNLRTTATSRVRVRLVARAGYSYNLTRFYNCPWEGFSVPNIDLGTVPLSGSGTISGSGVTQILVSGLCPAPVKPALEWGYGYGVVGILEEEQSPNWIVQDARLILVGEWPQISGSSGPGGGVITVSSALQGGSQVGFLDVKLGPPAALRLGGAWRVSPTNYGELGELQPYTNYTSANLRLAIRSTNFAIQVRPLSGFSVPANQTIRIQPGASVPLDLLYSVNPPLLGFEHVAGLGISGTPQTAYRIEATSFWSSPAQWAPYTNITLGPGLNWLPQATNTSSNRFYRALWLSQ